MPTDDPTDHSPAAVFDRASPSYDDVGVDFFRVFGRRLVDEVGVQRGARVLDVGAGRGAVLLPAARAVGPTGTAIGLDIAPGMIRRTADDLRQLGLSHASVELGDAAEPPADLGAFDVVLSSLVLFFLDDPADALRRWAQLVRPGGRLGLVTFLSDPDDDLIRPLFEQFVPMPDDLPASERPTPFELVRDELWLDAHLQRAGLRVDSVSRLRHAVHFDDIDQWWRWMWSHGARSAMESVPEEQRSAFLEAVAERLHPAEDGGLVLHVTVRFTVAVRGDDRVG